MRKKSQLASGTKSGTRLSWSRSCRELHPERLQWTDSLVDERLQRVNSVGLQRVNSVGLQR
eukprot:1188416-Prorocentrum_minimum.AAC.1